MSALEEQNREVERRLMAGEDLIAVPYLGDSQGRLVVYSLPRWREHPINRLKIAWVRWRNR